MQQTSSADRDGWYAQSLLTSKFSVPAVRGPLVARPRLSGRADLVSRYSLTLIAAPAGFGKTTLLAQWSASEPSKPFAWLSLERHDNELLSFWRYVIAALQTLNTSICFDEALNLLSSAQTPPIHIVITSLLNTLERLPHAVVLVLDDYHVIETQVIHASLDYLLEHLPPLLHVVIASRVDPPLSLARLRARGLLQEIRASALRFLPEESAQFLGEVMGLSMPQELVAALDARVEGWAAGLQLAALVLREREEHEQLVCSFTGSHRHIFDYLLEEVLAQQPEPIQMFLLRTCILSRLNGSLCEALMENGKNGNGQELLELVERRHLFIVPLDNWRGWYRYHHLFAEALQMHLQRSFPTLLPELHRCASTWHEQQGFVHEAIHHALAAHDVERTAHLLEHLARTTPGVWTRAESPQLYAWLEALPGSLLQARPQLSLLHIYTIVLVKTQEIPNLSQEISSRLQAIECQLQTGDATDPAVCLMQGLVGAILSPFVLLNGDVPGAITRARKALTALPYEYSMPRALAAQALCNAYRSSGELAAAREGAEELAAISHASHDVFSTLHALTNLAMLQIAQGHLSQAYATYQRALQVAGPSFKPYTSYAHFGLSTILLEWDRLAEAEEYLAYGIAHTTPQTDLGVVLWGYETLAHLRRMRGDIDGALSAIEEEEHIAQRNRLFSQVGTGNAIHRTFKAFRAHLHLLREDLAAANRWAEHCPPLDDEPITEMRAFELSVLARVHLARQRVDEALTLLEAVVSARCGKNPTRESCQWLVVQALALAQKYDVAHTSTVLAQALSQAEPENYIRVFVDEGLRMRVCLEAFLLLLQEGNAPDAHPVSEDYVRRLLTHFPPLCPSQQTGQPYERPLSERELEVLRCIAEGLSDRAIAQRLVLAESTIKTHAKRIYAKLHVSNRMQAVQHAQSLHIL